jgi:hypothetical protein
MQVGQGIPGEGLQSGVMKRLLPTGVCTRITRGGAHLHSIAPRPRFLFVKSQRDASVEPDLVAICMTV